MHTKKPETNQMTILRCGSILMMAGVLMTGTLVASGSSWPGGDGQDDSKSRARVISKNQKFAQIANEKSSSASVLTSSANDALDRALTAASRIDIAKYSSEKGEMEELVRKVIRARDVAAEAKAKADSAATEAANYAAQATDLAARYEAGEDIKPSDIRLAKRKAVKAEQRAKAQMKLAELKADLATRLAEEHANLLRDAASKASSLEEDGDSDRGEDRIHVAGEGNNGGDSEVDGIAEAISKYGFDPASQNNGNWGTFDDHSGVVDEMGWSILPISSDAKLIYVSSSEGDDGASGLTPDSPLKTIAAGKALLRDGYPDRLLLKRGDVFTEAIGSLSRSKDGALCGRSSDEPMVFGAYGVGDRPLLKIGSSTGINPWSTADDASSYIAVVGLHFYAHTRDPESPEFLGIEGGLGVRSISTGENFLIEDCRFDFCGIVFDPYQRDNPHPRFADLRIRRSVVYGNYSEGGHAQGVFINNTDGILLEENIFDHNGWNDLVGASRTKFNHNAYVTGYSHAYSSGLIARGNIFARGSSSGLQARPGGIVENNLFIGNATQLNFGFLQGDAPIPGGVEGRVVGNVFMDGEAIDPNGGGGLEAMWGIKIGNIRRADVRDNVLVRSGSIELSGKNDEGWAGVNNLSIHANQVSSDDFAVQLFHLGFKNTRINQNLIGGDEDSIRDRDGAMDSIDLEGNDVSVHDLLRDAGYYNQKFGGGDSLESFLEEARKQSRQNWRWMYAGDFACSWLRDQAKRSLGGD